MTGRSAVAVAGLLAGLGIVMAVWLSIDRRPPEWDHANHLERAVLCRRSLSEPAREALQEIIAESSFYPQRVSYDGVHVPALLVHWIVRNFDPTPRLRRLPMAVSVAPISIGAGRLEVGIDPDPLCPPKESR